MPIVSIIVPVYNTEPYLRRCVDSLLAQTFIDFECILINDGSSDKSPLICDEYAKNDNRVYVIHQKNCGVTAARKIGVEHAKGDWIFFVDSDDELIEDSISTLIEYINRDKIDIIIGSHKFIAQKHVNLRQYDKLEIDNIEYAKLLIKAKIHTGPCARLIRKDLFDNFTFDISAYFTKGEDYIMNIRLSQKARKIFIIPNIVYHYISRDDSAGKKKYDRIYEQKFKLELEKSLFQENKRLIKMISYYMKYHAILKRIFQSKLYRNLHNIKVKFITANKTKMPNY